MCSIRSPATLEIDPTGGPVKPAGSILGFPVYTNRWLPSTPTASQTSTPFLIFENIKACAFGDKEMMHTADEPAMKAGDFYFKPNIETEYLNPPKGFLPWLFGR
jgi:hypothetical protein